jgi:hypothetical protein
MLLSSGEIISTSWNLYKNNWQKLLPYLGIMFLPSLVVGIIAFGGNSLYNSLSNSVELLVSVIIAGVIGAIILGIVSLWATMALIKAIHLANTGSLANNWRQEFTSTKHLIWPVIYTLILQFLVIFGGTILLIIPGLIFSVWFMFTFYIVVIEEKRGVEALKASKTLVTGRWWGILWRALLPGLVFGLLTLVLQWLVSMPFLFFLKSGNFGATAQAFQTLLSSAVGILAAPLGVAAMIALYVSAKANPVVTALAKKSAE